MITPSPRTTGTSGYRYHHSYTERLLGWLDHQPRPSLLLVCLGLVVLIGATDYAITLDLGLSIFYLLPIAIASWSHSRTLGTGLSLLSTGFWLVAEYWAKQNLPPWLLGWNGCVRLGFFLIVCYLLTELKAAYHREQLIARLDGLTGALNHRYFMEQFAVETDRSRRYSFALTLAYMDLDNFKQINDGLGHAEGDRVLQHTVRAIQRSIRSTDVLGRIGGDEFVLMLPQTDYDQAQLVLSRLYGQLSNLRHIQGWESLGYSIGAITFRTITHEPEVMLKQVDELMYSIKRSSKNRLECREVSAASPTMTSP